jgi:hypothetical protein
MQQHPAKSNNKNLSALPCFTLFDISMVLGYSCFFVAPKESPNQAESVLVLALDDEGTTKQRNIDQPSQVSYPRHPHPHMVTRWLISELL